MARILLIEDDKEVLATIAEALRNAGHEVTEASDGPQIAAALRHAQRSGRPFQAFLSDYYLKDERGRTTLRGDLVLQAIRKDVDKKTPVIGASSDIAMWEHLARNDANLYPIAKVMGHSLAFAWNAPAVLAKLKQLGL